MQHAVGAVLVAVLVVLAGCSGVFGGSEEPTATLTPAAVPTDEPTPTPAPRLAPGLTAQGIENTSTLVAAHTSFLGNRSFTSRLNTTDLTSNGSVTVQYTSVLRAGHAGEGIYYISEINGSHGYPNAEMFPARTEGWADGEQVFRKETYANGTTTYDRQQYNADERLGTDGATLRFFLEPFGTANTSVTELERNGTTLYHIQGSIQADDSQGNVSLRMVVDSRGVIHEYRTIQRTPSGRNISRVITEGRFSAIGATDAPERPSWVDEAMNQTTATRPTETTREQ